MKKFTAMVFMGMFLVIHPLFSQEEEIRKNIYDALESKEVASIDFQLEMLKTRKMKGKEAYEGTLLMRKAGLVSGLNKKLSLFKEGRRKLESAISTDKTNGEFRFLRLMIQENAPGILNYNDDMVEDVKMMQEKYKDISSAAKDAITSYSKHSKTLKEHPVTENS